MNWAMTAYHFAIVAVIVVVLVVNFMKNLVPLQNCCGSCYLLEKGYYRIKVTL